MEGLNCKIAVRRVPVGEMHVVVIELSDKSSNDVRKADCGSFSPECARKLAQLLLEKAEPR